MNINKTLINSEIIQKQTLLPTFLILGRDILQIGNDSRTLVGSNFSYTDNILLNAHKTKEYAINLVRVVK